MVPAAESELIPDPRALISSLLLIGEFGYACGEGGGGGWRVDLSVRGGWEERFDLRKDGDAVIRHSAAVFVVGESDQSKTELQHPLLSFMHLFHS